jgi:hypothetical protein
MRGNTNNLEGTCYTSKISRGCIRPIIIIVVINSHAYGAMPWPLGLLLYPAVSDGHDILLDDQFRTKLTYTPPLLHASVELGCKKT